jgi:CRP-like cAMP-binding protein
MFDQFRSKFPIDEEHWEKYSSLFKRLEVPARTVLLKEGEISKKMFLIEKGCIRVWFNNQGKEITLQFFFENNMVSSIESFRKKFPSPLSIETIEPSILWWIHKKDFDRIIAEISEIQVLRELLINMLFERTFGHMQHFFSFMKDSPAQRYLNLIEEKPAIVQRIPQHYIASYLGISAVHLSRIKNTITKKKNKPSI